MGKPDMDDPRLSAALDMIGRTGAVEFQLRWSDEQQPVIWMAVGRWETGHETAAAFHPLVAVLRLLEQVMDGGMCAHCKRPSGVVTDLVPDPDMPMPELICWYQFDPELGSFRRDCEGDI